MLLIREYDRETSHRTLPQGGTVFHQALACVLKGEKRFHVRNPRGADYDLEYVENQAWCEASPDYPDSALFRREVMYPPYLLYDEGDRERICFDILEGVRRVWMEEVNEYTVVLTDVLLRFTELPLFWKDERIRWFYPEEPRIRMAEEPPEPERKTTLRVVGAFRPSAFTTDFQTMDQVVLFHQFFVYQWLSELPLNRAKYAEILVARNEGIGSVLAVYARTRHFLERFGLQVTLRPGSSRYPDSLLRKYFTLPLTPADADDANTVYITNYYSLLFTRMLRLASVSDLEIGSLNPAFLAEMREYRKAVFGDKRVLGVLLRGSDYISAGMSGASAPVTVESALPVIRRWMAEDGYDAIFLATEDQDILDQMREAFPGKLLAVAQERYSVRDFSKNAVTISELERKRRATAEEYGRALEDTTVNYFYALYLLSRCESFMYSGQCGGEAMTKALNRGRFKRTWCFAVGGVMK